MLLSSWSVCLESLINSCSVICKDLTFYTFLLTGNSPREFGTMVNPLLNPPRSMLFRREQKCSGHTSTLFFGGEGEVSWVNRALEGSILKLDIQRAFFLTFLSKIVVWCLKCDYLYFVETKNGLNNSFDLKSTYEYLKCFGTDKKTS